MGTVHDLILRHGVERARDLVSTKLERICVDAAAQLMAEEEDRLGISHAGFALTSLPHKQISEPFWKRDGHHVTLMVESGRDRLGHHLGVPYGSIARLILVYLQTEAIRNNSPEVELGRSMRTWLTSMGMSPGGKNYKLVAEQARRISACTLAFIGEKRGVEIRKNGSFVDTAITMTGTASETQPSLWQDKVILNEHYWKSLKEHPVPLQEAALRAIGGRSMAIDVYIWLAYRLHSLDRPTPIRWESLFSQFGGGFRRFRAFKVTFLECLQVALAVYPAARVSVDKDGLILYPSRPPVERRPHPVALPRQ